MDLPSIVFCKIIIISRSAHPIQPKPVNLSQGVSSASGTALLGSDVAQASPSKKKVDVLEQNAQSEKLKKAAAVPEEKMQERSRRQG